MTIDRNQLGIAIAAVAVLTLGSAWLAAPAAAEEEERRVVKKIRIDCGGAGCAEHGEIEEILETHLGRGHAFAWSSSDGPHRFRFMTRAGGGFLGVQLAELTPELRGHFGVAEDAGVMISKVVEDSPAARAGLRVADIVTAIDGKSVRSGAELAHSIRGRDDGETVLLEVWRDGSVQNLTATIEEREGAPLGLHHAYVLGCDDDEEDCSFAERHFGGAHDAFAHLGCEDGPCEVRVECDENGDCTCTVDGEETECSGLKGYEE